MLSTFFLSLPETMFGFWVTGNPLGMAVKHVYTLQDNPLQQINIEQV